MPGTTYSNAFIVYVEGRLQKVAAGDNLTLQADGASAGGIMTAAKFAGSGTDLTNLSVADLEAKNPGDVLADALLSANVPLLDAGQALATPRALPQTWTGANVFSDNLTTESDLQVDGNAIVGGNLVVTGDIVSRGSTSVILQDSYLDLNGGNNTGTAAAGGLAVNVQSVAGSTISGAVTTFTASGAGTNPTFTVTGDHVAALNVPGRLVLISGSADGKNDGQYIIVGATLISGNTVVEVKGNATSADPIDLTATPFAHNNFVAATGETADVCQIKVGAISVAGFQTLKKSGGAYVTAGQWCSAYGDQEANFVNGWLPFEAAGSTSLQAAYDVGQTIDTTGNAAFEVTGDQDITLTATGAALALGGGTTTVTSTTGTLKLDAGAALLLEVDGQIVANGATNSAAEYEIVGYAADGSGLAAVSCTSTDVRVAGVRKDIDASTDTYASLPGAKVSMLYTGTAPSVGDRMYLSATAGMAQSAPPSAAGSRVYFLGVARTVDTGNTRVMVDWAPQYILDL